MRDDAGRRALRPELPTDPFGWWPSIVVAFATTGFFLLLRLALMPLVGPQTPYVVFTLAVAITSGYGGWRAGLMSTALSLWAGHKFFVAPFPHNGVSPGDEITRVTTFGVVCLVLVLLAHVAQEGRRRQRDLLRELDDERARYRSMVESVPAIIVTLKGKEFVYEQANAAYLRLRGRRDVLGKPLREAVPDIDTEGYVEMLRRVIETGEPHHGKSAVFETEPGSEGEPEKRYFDYTYVPLRNRDGKVDSVLGHGVDVTERVEAERALAEAKAELERRVDERTAELSASNESLRGFNYHVSHDLRAPLRTISSTSRMLQEDFGEKLPLDAQEMLNRQIAAARRLGMLIDDLLAFSRLSQSELRRQTVDVSAAAERVAGDATAAHSANGVTVEVAPGLVAHADPSQLELVLGNLVENAAKYSPEGGTVRVGRREDGAFFVSDEGIGIDPGYFRVIFEAFQRLHRDDEFEGTGIGLANVKQIVERHGGKIWVESALGRGSTFLFTLG